MSSLTGLIALGRWSPERLIPGTAGGYGVLDVRFILLAVLYLAVLLRGSATAGAIWTKLVLLVLAIIYLAISAIWTGSGTDEAYLSRKLCDVFIIVATLFAMPFALRDRWDLRVFQVLLLIACGGIVLMSVMSLGFGALLESTGGNASRLAVLQGGPNVLARLAFTALMLAITMGLQLKNRVCLVLAGVSLCVVILTGSRGGLIATTVLLISWVANIARGRLWTNRIVPLFQNSRTRRMVLLILAGAALGLAVSYLPSLSGVRQAFVDRILHQTLLERYMSNRDVLLWQAIHLWSENPILGGGLASFSGVGAGQLYAHNIFLEFLSEGGLVGLLLFLLGLFSVTHYVLVNRCHVDEASFSLFLASLVAAQFSGDLYDSRIVFFYAAVCVLSVDIARRPRALRNWSAPKRFRIGPRKTV